MIAERLIHFLISSNNENSGRSKIQGISNRQIRTLVVYYWARVLQRIFLLNSYGFTWSIIAIALIAIWHIPAVFDFAILYEPVHILQHLSFVAVGICSLMAIRSLGESFTLFILFLLIGMMGLGGLMLTLAETKIYDVYSISSHNNAGNYMLISSIALLLVGLPTYLIHRTFLHIRAKY
jgi:cytochrome c oxidase assembly factor CtaG